MTVDRNDRRASPEATRVRARDAALRRTRTVIVGIAAGAVALTGAFSVVAAQAFKGHAQGAASAAQRVDDGASAMPQGTQQNPAPLQPPAQPPAASDPQPSASAPEPQVSGGS